MTKWCHDHLDFGRGFVLVLCEFVCECKLVRVSACAYVCVCVCVCVCLCEMLWMVEMGEWALFLTESKVNKMKSKITALMWRHKHPCL